MFFIFFPIVAEKNNLISLFKKKKNSGELLSIYSKLSQWIEDRIVEIKITPLKTGKIETKPPQINPDQDEIVENYKLALELLTNSKLRLK